MFINFLQADKTKRSPNFTEEERMVLLRFVQQYKKKLLGKAGRPGHGDDKVHIMQNPC